jgi:two-component system, NarL family, nitrate/nitrite response regulator NarL
MRHAGREGQPSANMTPSGWQGCPPSQRMRRQTCAIVLIGRCTLVREGLARVLSASEFQIVASAPSVFDVTLKIPQETCSSFFVIDVSDDLETGVAEIRLLKQRYPAGRIAVVASHGELPDPTMLFRAGANVCVGNFAHCDVLLKTLELVMLDEVISPFVIIPGLPVCEAASKTEWNACEQSVPGRNVVARELNRQPKAPVGVDSSRHAPCLSAREKSIVRCLVEGDSNKAIARKIAIAEATVKVHVKAILRKIRVQNRTQAAIWAINHGPLDEQSSSEGKVS